MLTGNDILKTLEKNMNAIQQYSVREELKEEICGSVKYTNEA